MVAHLELLHGTRAAATLHMNGLRALIEMRGGFTSFTTPLQLLLQRLIRWVDIFYSETFGTVPMFPPAEIWDLSWHSRDPLALPGSPIGLLPQNLESTVSGAMKWSKHFKTFMSFVGFKDRGPCRSCKTTKEC
ncbi:uncharacterized protein A1O9_00094 [Exophiala aquamarina CBS 119918]|uniref:Transcription factor domain-containing protein n=1 Tax=Exophiala aquamarina CBS 119918 TaxID=1182545 RepID=A0A072PQU4_9EURO|nr:uncharacterized protein A1O9_00094 [Exophiala aquamarina CBS 119918]KEF62122.1 hypothetical protein A1O9_00094 [Exophiala aquamarina CBS 119918]